MGCSHYAMTDERHNDTSVQTRQRVTAIPQEWVEVKVLCCFSAKKQSDVFPLVRDVENKYDLFIQKLLGGELTPPIYISDLGGFL